VVKVSVLNREGEERDAVEIPEGLFEQRVNTDVIHQSVVMYQAGLRQGNASTKERADVSGGGKKPFRQKGTGRARAGSSRSPLWHGGGVVFGPHPRDFSYTVPKKVKKSALRESLKAKFQANQLKCIEDLTDPIEKTKDFAQMLKHLDIKGKTLAALDGSDATVERVSRNIPTFNLMRAQDINAYDVMRNKNVIFTKSALIKVLERVTK